MKNFLARFKGMNYKQIALQHGEKAGVGLIALVVVLPCLWSGVSNLLWGGYSSSPGQLSEAAKKSETLLVSSAWPPAKQAEFALVEYSNRARQEVIQDVELAAFQYRTPMSFKIYPRDEPVDEPKLLAVLKPIATSGTFVMATVPKIPEGMEPNGLDGGVDPVGNDAEARDEDPAFRRRNRGPQPGMPPGMTGMPPGPPGPGMFVMGSGGGSGRGVRYVALRAVFPYAQQLQYYARALHPETDAQAADFLEFFDFKVQRQKAVRGEDPWVGKWEDLNVQIALDLLSECEDFDPDVVPTDYTDVVLTMPLPMRYLGVWSSQVNHPWLKAEQLSEEQREQELALNAAALEKANELEGGVAGVSNKKRGFARGQRDINAAKKTVGQSRDGMDYMRKMMQSMAPAGPPGANGPGMMNMGQPGMAGMPGMSGGRSAKYLLFRYFDVAVEPGECYRYRIQIEVVNPSYGRSPDEVREVSITEGETRTSPWSDPSPPVVVEKDVDYFLAGLPHSLAAAKYAAEMKIFQWDPDVGTFIADKLKLMIGQFIGGKAKTERLNVAVPSLTEEDVRFTSKDLLVDVNGPPAIAIDENADLGINRKDWSKLMNSGAFDLAVTINPAGELFANDPRSQDGLEKQDEKRVEEERKPFKDLENADASAPTPGGLEGYMEQMKKKDGTGKASKDDKADKKKRMRNPAKMGGYPDMMPPTPPGPPGQAFDLPPGQPPTKAKSKKKR